MRGTNENFDEVAVSLIARWLIEVAQRGETLTYGEAKRRLETFYGFDTLFPTRIGWPTGRMMERIWERFPDAPPLNMLMVRADDGLPGDGATSFLQTYTGNDRLNRTTPTGQISNAWLNALQESISAVRQYPDWENVFQAVFGQPYEIDTQVVEAGEQDGQPGGRGGGEGENHRRLRLWVRDNPADVSAFYVGGMIETEFELASGDRVDVVYFKDGSWLAIEVKSRDSSFSDLRRGIFQCVKYRAVLEAQEHATEMKVEVLLVTGKALPPELANLARRLEIPHLQVTLD